MAAVVKPRGIVDALSNVKFSGILTIPQSQSNTLEDKNEDRPWRSAARLQGRIVEMSLCGFRTKLGRNCGCFSSAGSTSFLGKHPPYAHFVSFL